MSSSTVFSERPYAAILKDKFLSVRCSNCFDETSSVRCPKCEKVVYCNDECVKADSKLHETECKADPETLSSDTRLVARFLVRQRIDGGQAAQLSENFPANYKTRTCKDLTSHYNDVKKDKRRSERLEQIWTTWRDRLGTSALLGSLKKSDIHRAYATVCINSFAIFESGVISNEKSFFTTGVGLYLNASRFNHSCVPDMFATFKGSTMSLMRTAKSGGGENVSTTVMKEKDFNRLTINYGVPPTDSHGAYVPLISQRIKSLQYRYYFKCRCPKCADPKARSMEESAANVECTKCKQPYVWITGRPMKLRQSCSCTLKEKPKLDPVDQVNVKQLESLWEKVMTEADTKSDPYFVVMFCKPLWHMARKYWHPTANLRLCQLNERMFHAYKAKAMHPTSETTDDDRVKDLMMAAIAAEDMINCYETRIRRGDITLAIYDCQIAAIYSLLGQTAKAYDRYTRAAESLDEIKDDANSAIVLSWRAQLRLEPTAVAVVTEKPISMSVSSKNVIETVAG